MLRYGVLNEKQVLLGAFSVIVKTSRRFIPSSITHNTLDTLAPETRELRSSAQLWELLQ